MRPNWNKFVGGFSIECPLNFPAEKRTTILLSIKFEKIEGILEGTHVLLLCCELEVPSFLFTSIGYPYYRQQ